MHGRSRCGHRSRECEAGVTYGREEEGGEEGEIIIRPVQQGWWSGGRTLVGLGLYCILMT